MKGKPCLDFEVPTALAASHLCPKAGLAREGFHYRKMDILFRVNCILTPLSVTGVFPLGMISRRAENYNVQNGPHNGWCCLKML